MHTPAAQHHEYDLRKGSPSSRGYDRRWRNYAKQFLREHPLCVMCQAENHTRLATLVDHITPIHGPYDPLFYEPTNHQGLCHQHHQIKTSREKSMLYSVG